MERTSKVYQAYVRILQEELIPAMGCTEPIAIAYAAAKAREVLGQLPGSVWITVHHTIQWTLFHLVQKKNKRCSVLLL